MRASVKGAGRKRVHQFVAQAFIQNPDNKPIVNHINGKKDDNRVENLEWVTAKENSQHAGKTGLLCNKDELRRGKIVAILNSTKEATIYNSQVDAAVKIGIDDSEVNKVLKGKRNTSHGYIFAYLNEKVV